VFLDLPWQDIGYNFLVGEDGVAYDGMGWDFVSHHIDPHNDYLSLGIAFIGTFNNSIPNDAALERTKLLLSCLVTKVG